MSTIKVGSVRFAPPDPYILDHSLISDFVIKRSATVQSQVGTYHAQSWMQLNGTGTIAIRGSANVSSAGDLGVGWYRTNQTLYAHFYGYAFGFSYTAEVAVQHTLGYLWGDVKVSHYDVLCCDANNSNSRVDKGWFDFARWGRVA